MKQHFYHLRKKAGKCLVAACMAVLLGVSMTACSGFENTEIVLTTGLSDKQLFKVGSSVCTLAEAMIYVDAYSEQYETVYGVEMWEHDFGGVTLEAYVKSNIVSQLATIKAMTLLAKDYEVVLDKVDEEQIANAAKTYYESLSEEEIAYMNLERKDAEQLFRDHLLATRVYEEITRDVNMEVSDDEARIITVQQIFFKTTATNSEGKDVYSIETAQAAYERAQEAMAALESGAEFITVASSYNQEDTLTRSFGRGAVDPKLEEAAFALEKQEVSGIVETDGGYYILKCTENFDREATEENKKTLIERRKDDVFEQVYEELIRNTPSEFHTKIWEGVRMENPSQMHTGVTFFTVYDTFFG